MTRTNSEVGSIRRCDIDDDANWDLREGYTTIVLEKEVLA